MSRNKPTTAIDIARLVRASRYSWQGLCYAWQHEAAFRQELLAGLILVPLGIWLGRNGVERALLLGCYLLVLLAELFNSAIEAIVDRQGTAPHPLAKAAKDLGSAAVLISLLLTAVTWFFLLLDRW